MSHDSDPPRLADGGSDMPPELQGLFQNARRDMPNDAQMERLLTRLGPVVGVGAALAGDAVRAGAQQAASQVSVSSLTTLTKVLAAVGGAGLLAAGAAWFTSEHEPPRAPVVHSAPPERAPVAQPPTPLEAPPAVVAPTESAASEAPAAAVKTPPRAEPLADNVKAEAALLERARAVAATEPKRALALTKEHARRFPRGVLAQEREVIAIEALRQLGRRNEADNRATRFQEAYPGSAHQRTVGSSSPEK